MQKLRSFLTNLLSFGVHTGLSEAKKFAIRIATFDAIGSAIAMFFYVLYSYENQLFPLFYVHLSCLCLVLFGMYLIYKRFYDIARYLIALTGLAEIFITADSVGPGAGYEFYYFTQILIPYITWSIDEKWWKGTLLSGISATLLVVQHMIGSGVFFDITPVPKEDKLISIIVVMVYIFLVLIVARWKLYFAQKSITEQQNELIHSTSLISLGEMAGGIAHEINNPLQSLSLQIRIMKETVGDLKQLDLMQNTIFKMGRMVQGLKDLARKDDDIENEQFHFAKIIEDVLSISAHRLHNKNIQLSLVGEDDYILKGNPTQISQVFINLLNNSIDAIKDLDSKWIRISMQPKNDYLHITVMDSGKGIPPEVAEKMMKPYFTTKGPTQGTGIGLSISKSIVEKNFGTLFYDANSTHTSFVVLLPLLGEEKRE